MFPAGTACLLPNLPLWLLLELASLKLTFLLDRLHWGEHSNCLCLFHLSMGDVQMFPRVSFYIVAWCKMSFLHGYPFVGNLQHAPLYMGCKHMHVTRHTQGHTIIKLYFSVHKITGSSLCCWSMIKVIVTLIFKGLDCFSMCAEQIVPAQAVIKTLVHFQPVWITVTALLDCSSHLLSTCFLVVNKSNSSIMNEIKEV